MFQRSIRLLLVEDNPADVRLAQEALKEGRIQNEMIVVGDGEEALAYLRGEGSYAGARLPDMVLLDINLPKLDGLEVLEQIRRDPRLSTMPVVVLTSSHIQTRLLESYGLDVKCYIQKPLELERYLDAVRCFGHLGLAIVNIATA